MDRNHTIPRRTMRRTQDTCPSDANDQPGQFDSPFRAFSWEGGPTNKLSHFSGRSSSVQLVGTDVGSYLGLPAVAVGEQLAPQRLRRIAVPRLRRADEVVVREVIRAQQRAEDVPSLREQLAGLTNTFCM